MHLFLWQLSGKGFNYRVWLPGLLNPIYWPISRRDKSVYWLTPVISTLRRSIPDDCCKSEGSLSSRMTPWGKKRNREQQNKNERPWKSEEFDLMTDFSEVGKVISFTARARGSSERTQEDDISQRVQGAFSEKDSPLMTRSTENVTVFCVNVCGFFHFYRFVCFS